MKQRFLQGEFWARFKTRHGWKAMFFIDEGGALRQVETFGSGGEDSRLSVLVRAFSVRLKKFSIAYVPMKPEFDAAEGVSAEALASQMQSLSQRLREFLPKNTICVRFDPALDFADFDGCKKFIEDFSLHAGKAGMQIVKSRSNIQPPDTVLLPLSGTEEEILAQMKSKWRYNIRLAQKKGVEVQKYTAADEGFAAAFDEFFALFRQTSERDGVQFHSRGYYEDLLKSSAEGAGNCETPLVTLYVARHEGDALAAIITLFCGREAVYLYGASGNAKRNLMPAYLLQWTAICDAKAYGCPVYDFYGCPPTADEGHPMHGLFLFKTGFGGNLIHRPGSFDAVLRPFDYALYSAAERLRAWWYKGVMKKIRGR